MTANKFWLLLLAGAFLLAACLYFLIVRFVGWLMEAPRRRFLKGIKRK
jgi:hypothetical protein